MALHGTALELADLVGAATAFWATIKLDPWIERFPFARRHPNISLTITFAAILAAISLAIGLLL